MFSISKHHAMHHCPGFDSQKQNRGSRPASKRYQAQETTYDGESGQVYAERTVRVPLRRKVNWINEYKTPGLVKRRHANKDGAASLFDMAKAKLAREMANLTASHLKGIPSSIGGMLWNEVEDRYQVLINGRSARLIISQSTRDFPRLAHICLCFSRPLQIFTTALLYEH